MMIFSKRHRWAQPFAGTLAAAILVCLASFAPFAQAQIPAKVAANDAPALNIVEHAALLALEDGAASNEAFALAGPANPIQDQQNGPSTPAAATPATQAPGPNSPPAESSSTPANGQQEQQPPGGKRVLGVLPNYRTASANQEDEPISAGRKMHIAVKDSFDYPLFLLAGAYAGLDQLTDSDKSYGQGVEGYAKRLGAWYADESLGNMLTEGVFPVLLHQDPRYFVRGRGYGGIMKRTGYALSRVIITDKDGGGKQFNYSEWLGNATATAIGNIYHVDDRDAADNTLRLLEQVGTDAVSQVLKEFWPDIKQKFFHRNSN